MGQDEAQRMATDALGGWPMTTSEQAQEVWMEIYAQDRILSECDSEEEEGRRASDNPTRTATTAKYSQTSVAAVPPERKP